jgi:hypothetical protein
VIWNDWWAHTDLAGSLAFPQAPGLVADLST